jgi:hypothetical protein
VCACTSNSWKSGMSFFGCHCQVQKVSLMIH